jgi:hypothetical protein
VLAAGESTGCQASIAKAPIFGPAPTATKDIESRPEHRILCMTEILELETKAIRCFGFLVIHLSLLVAVWVFVSF